MSKGEKGFLRSNILKLLICPNKGLKPKDSSFTIMNDKEKQQLLPFQRLEPANDIFVIFYRLINLPTNCYSSKVHPGETC